MKLTIKPQEFFHICCGVYGVTDLLKAANIVIGQVREAFAKRKRFDPLADLPHLHALIDIDTRNPDATIGNDDDEALAFELFESFPNGHTTRPELCGKFFLTDAQSRRELAAQYLLTNFTRYSKTQRGFIHKMAPSML